MRRFVLLLVLFLVARGTLATCAFAQDLSSQCANRFQSFLVMEEVGANSPKLSEYFPLSIEKAQSKIILRTIQDLWAQKVDLSAVRKDLVQISKGHFQKITDESELNLKIARKYGVILRASFDLFDSSHRAPKIIDEFVTVFGKLNDALQFDQKKIAKNLAQKVIDLMGRLPSKGAVQVSPAGKGSFAKHFRAVTESVRKNMARETMSASEFHQLRKDMKQFLYAFQLIEIVEPGGFETYRYLSKLNEGMGAIHDELVGRALTGKLKYDEATVDVPAELRQDIQEFLNRLRITG